MGALALFFYFSFDPETGDGWFFPKCPVYLFTGLYCPSCGSQRALHALLHGNILHALHYNYFLIFGVPFFSLLIVAALFREKMPSTYRFLYGKNGAIIYLAVYLFWFAVRNIVNL